MKNYPLRIKARKMKPIKPLKVAGDMMKIAVGAALVGTSIAVVKDALS